MITVATKKISEALELPRKTVLERARREGWPCVEKSGGLQFIEVRLPIDIRLALSGAGNAGPSAAEETQEQKLGGHAYKKASEKAREIATWRAAVLAEYKKAKAAGVNVADFVDSYNSGAICPSLLDRIGLLSARTLYRWLRDSKEAKTVSALIPGYGSSRRGAGETLSEAEKAYLECFWLRPEQHSVRHALRLLKWNLPDSSCSYRTACRYLQSLPQPLIDFKRLGVTRASNLHQPYVVQDIYRYRSLDQVVSDHHCLDCVVMYKGKLIRPWITTFQDYRSGKILGWCPSVSPSSLSIIAAYYMCCLQYGIPRSCLFDNGKDYRSQLLNGKTEKIIVYTPEGIEREEEVHLEGVFAVVGSEIHFTETYSGKSKGRQENYFKLMSEYFAKDSGAFVGSDSRSRPEEVQTYYRSINGIAKREDFPDWDWFVQAVSAVIRLINDTFASDGKGMHGKTRSEVFAENIPDDVRRVDKEVLTLALSKSEIRKVKNNCIKIGERLFYAEELFMWSGREVIVRQQLQGDCEILVCDPAGCVICTATADYTYEGKTVGEALGRVRSARKGNLLKLAEIGTGEAVADPEYKTMIDVAMHKYGTDSIPDINLDSSVAEEKTDAESGKEIAQMHKTSKRKLISPFEATAEDYVLLKEIAK